jgi:predicted nucleotidyltransferase
MATRLDSATLDMIRERIKEAVPDVIAIYQFGSTVEGTEHGESDLDLAILAQRPLENLDRWELQEDLAVEVGRDVDLVDLRSATTVMRAQVLETGTVVAETDRTARQQFEMRVCSAYAMLNEERAGILEDVRARGRVYGR